MASSAQTVIPLAFEVYKKITSKQSPGTLAPERLPRSYLPYQFKSVPYSLVSELLSSSLPHFHIISDPLTTLLFANLCLPLQLLLSTAVSPSFSSSASDNPKVLDSSSPHLLVPSDLRAPCLSLPFSPSLQTLLRTSYHRIP
mmetsp:Transcript_15140/g.23571  ORF Transcript_15140/g.23571 Transcript_15140/m.23571 type:complete len:142 (-) Transcript_15140:40-465(-)